MSDPHGGSLIQELQKCQAELSRVKAELEELKLCGCIDWKKKAERHEAALKKIEKEATHVYWEDRGFDEMIHADTCACKVAKEALAGYGEGK